MIGILQRRTIEAEFAKAILAEFAARGHDWSNLQAMCHRCHTAKTNTQDGGGWQRTTHPNA